MHVLRVFNFNDVTKSCPSRNFNALLENKILAKISELTVLLYIPTSLKIITLRMIDRYPSWIDRQNFQGSLLSLAIFQGWGMVQAICPHPSGFDHVFITGFVVMYFIVYPIQLDNNFSKAQRSGYVAFCVYVSCIFVHSPVD